MKEDQQTKARSTDGLFSLNDLAEYLSCSRTYAANLISDGTIPSFKIGTLRRVRKADVDTYIELRAAAKD
jgi:excisionase family DNA binding protein